MARVIQSPGVEIKEVDLSLRTDIPAGTKVLVQGFASQGNTYELVNVTTKDELDEIYFGSAGPTNAAERYFYHTCSEVLNSPATLYVTRFPYGSADGTGFNGDYVALAYPATGNSTMLEAVYTGAIGMSGITLTGSGYLDTGTYISQSLVLSATIPVGIGRFYAVDVGSNILSGYIAFGPAYTSTSALNGTYNPANGTFAMTGTYNISSGGAFQATYGSWSEIQNYASTSALNFGAPVVVPLTEEQYMDIQGGMITWNNNGGVVSSYNTLGNAAFIVVNDAKTTINENYEGYYLALADNDVINAAGYTAVQQVNTLAGVSSLTPLASTALGFYLTGTDVVNPGNISEVVETCTTYDFANAEYNNALVLYMFRLRRSNAANDTSVLYYAPVENFVGKLDSEAKAVNSITRNQDSFYLADAVNNNSDYLKMFVNSNISKYNTITDVNVTANTMNPIGSYVPCRSTDETLKYIGSVPDKIEKALTLAENKQLLDMDVVLDAGLSTIWSYVYSADTDGLTIFDDEMDVSADLTSLTDAATGMDSDIAQTHRTVFNFYNNFCAQTRKDCIHISDPLRCIFVNGPDQKILSRNGRNFSSNVYTPMRNLYAVANSNYSCTYANWVKNYDSNSGKYVWLPFSGWQASVIARMDSNLQPWYAPFGLNNGVINTVVDIAVKTNQKQQDSLYRIGVNPVVFFNGDGFVVWGQKTLQAKPSAFDRINVRRLFLVLERATMKIMRYFVGEPNTVFTRTRVSNVLKPIFDLAKNNEGVYDYLIVCDERNNTATVIDNNELKVDIYLKPVRTAEFILVTFYATRTDQDFNELIG